MELLEYFPVCINLRIDFEFGALVITNHSLEQVSHKLNQAIAVKSVISDKLSGDTMASNLS